jgi:hypothetical protein
LYYIKPDNKTQTIRNKYNIYIYIYIYISQNPKSIPNIIRNNVDIYIYTYANTTMVLEKLCDEVNSLFTEEEFEMFIYMLHQNHIIKKCFVGNIRYQNHINFAIMDPTNVKGRVKQLIDLSKKEFPHVRNV